MLTFVIQVANQEGVFLADLLSGRISDPAKKSFKYVHRGERSAPVPRSRKSDLTHSRTTRNHDEHRWWRRIGRGSVCQCPRSTGLYSMEGVLLDQQSELEEQVQLGFQVRDDRWRSGCFSSRR
jgi:hypothetical protein